MRGDNSSTAEAYAKAAFETLKAQAEVEPLKALADQLSELKKSGPGVLEIYLRNVRLRLYSQAQQIILEERK